MVREKTVPKFVSIAEAEAGLLTVLEKHPDEPCAEAVREAVHTLQACKQQLQIGHNWTRGRGGSEVRLWRLRVGQLVKLSSRS